MEDRLTQCLHEIMYCDECSSELRQILDNVLELSDKISYFDATDFDDYLLSDEFADDAYELFGVNLGEIE